VLVGVARWYNPSLDHSIIASSANLRLGRTTTASEDDSSNDIKMAT
jgi:hypothetical protein